MDATPPQHLPISARWCVSHQHCIDLEVARTADQQRIGLMQRQALPALRGMWFPFNRPQPLRFWMFNTLAPLDMLFLRQGEVIAIDSKVPPCPSLPCRGYGPDQPADGVVELGAGEAMRLGIEVGDSVEIDEIP